MVKAPQQPQVEIATYLLAPSQPGLALIAPWRNGVTFSHGVPIAPPGATARAARVKSPLSPFGWNVLSWRIELKDSGARLLAAWQ